MLENGVRTAGMIVMMELSQMVVPGYHLGLLRACYVAAAGASTPGTVALRIAAAAAQSSGTPFWASALPGQFVDFLTLSAIAGRSVLLVKLLCSFSSLRRVRVLQYSFSGCCFQVSESGAPRSRCMPETRKTENSRNEICFVKVLC